MNQTPGKREDEEEKIRNKDMWKVTEDVNCCGGNSMMKDSENGLRMEYRGEYSPPDQQGRVNA